ncbi:hypothetical protein [Streptomyces sp. NPDC088925]|uniref:hypothetical protein n=1 Tax=Streptomyces sp. NPDC088925 TaxID=3365914 RepID=UPI00380FDAC3
MEQLEIDLWVIPAEDEMPLVRPPRSGGIQDRFEEFHALNPWVLRHLEQLTADAVKKGFTRIGIGMLFEVLRYRFGLTTHGDLFRLNNDFRSRYVRLMCQRHPTWRRHFELRSLRAD